MSKTFKNLIHVLKSFRVATVTNLLGLTLSFFAFMLVMIHVNREYSYNSSIVNKERIFRIENMRDDKIWEPNFSRPQLERFIASSSYIEMAGITNNIAYHSSDIGISTTSGPDAITYMEKIERVRPDFIKVFSFDIIAGNPDCLEKDTEILLSESVAKKLFGDENPIGKLIFLSELHGFENEFSIHGSPICKTPIVGGVYRDFPENSYIKNVAYVSIPEEEMMGDWYTGPYYGYVLLSDAKMASVIVEEYLERHAEALRQVAIDDIRLVPLPELYFNPQLRSDSLPSGSQTRTNMLLFIAVLVILIAVINYINLSVALAPVRIKSITTRKVLGCSQNALLINLVIESLCISLLSFFFALGLLFVVEDMNWITEMLGHSLSLILNSKLIVWTGLLAVIAGIIAGVYPAFYMTSFPAVMALNGSFSLTGKAKALRQVLIGFQFIISIALIIGSLFVYLQNKFIENVGLGFDKENVVEVRISAGTAITKNNLYRELLIEHPDIKDVAFIQTKFVTDESRSNIGYTYQGKHSYMTWLGVSPNFPEVMEVQLLAGRFFYPDEDLNSERAVCMINETAAKEILSHFEPNEQGDIYDLIGTNINDNNRMIPIVGIFKDFHFQSVYQKVKPIGIWVAPRFSYRRSHPETYSYVKITGSNPAGAIEHIRKVTDELHPGYPADIEFMDTALNELYRKSHQQGIMVGLSCLLAVLLSLVGVFGMVIFEAQGREKEIAIRKVFGSTIREILWMFNTTFLQIVCIGFIISAPLAYYGVNLWLQSFAYKTPLYLWVFLVALIIIAVLTILTVTLQSYQAATANPSGKLQR